MVLSELTPVIHTSKAGLTSEEALAFPTAGKVNRCLRPPAHLDGITAARHSGYITLPAHSTSPSSDCTATHIHHNPQSLSARHMGGFKVLIIN